MHTAEAIGKHLVNRDVDASDAPGCVAGQEIHCILRNTVKTVATWSMASLMTSSHQA